MFTNCRWACCKLNRNKWEIDTKGRWKRYGEIGRKKVWNFETIMYSTEHCRTSRNANTIYSIEILQQCYTHWNGGFFFYLGYRGQRGYPPHIFTLHAFHEKASLYENENRLSATDYRTTFLRIYRICCLLVEVLFSWLRWLVSVLLINIAERMDLSCILVIIQCIRIGFHSCQWPSAISYDHFSVRSEWCCHLAGILVPLFIVPQHIFDWIHLSLISLRCEISHSCLSVVCVSVCVMQSISGVVPTWLDHWNMDESERMGVHISSELFSHRKCAPKPA